MWPLSKKSSRDMSAALCFPGKARFYALRWQLLGALCLAFSACFFVFYYRVPVIDSVAVVENGRAFNRLNKRFSAMVRGWHQTQAMHLQLLHQIKSVPKSVWLQIVEVDVTQGFLQWVVPPKTTMSLAHWQRAFHVTHLQVDHQASGDVWRIRGVWPKGDRQRGLSSNV